MIKINAETHVNSDAIVAITKEKNIVGITLTSISEGSSEVVYLDENLLSLKTLIEILHNDS